MESFDSFITNAVEKIKINENLKKETINKLKNIRLASLKNLESLEFLEDKFVSLIKTRKINEKIGGVDSGFMERRFTSIDITLVRACGVVFNYNNGILNSTKYIPNAYDLPKPIISYDSLENDEFGKKMSIDRLNEEISIALRIVKEEKPDYMFLDGSILPQRQDKPSKESVIFEKYVELVELFKELYKESEKNNCTLIGTIEDSTSDKVCNLIKKNFCEKIPSLNKNSLSIFKDQNFFHYFLNKGERSFVFPYTLSNSHTIMNDFSEYKNKLNAFYLKATEFDFPLRVEFLCGKENISEKINEIASTVYVLSSMNREYSYPSVLIEADLRAKLNPRDISIVFDKITDKAGKHFFTLRRRDRRPF